jgi:hypothetical protein
MNRPAGFLPRTAAPETANSWMTVQSARWIGLTAFLVYALFGGGRIVGSDEVTMLELSRAMLHGGIEVPVGATLEGPGGRHYTKNAAGQAVLALPLVAVAELATTRLPTTEQRRSLALRFAVSFFNAAVTALVLVVFYLTIRALGVAAPGALDATLMLGFTTPLWVYAKSFMAEPLQALGLLLALSGSARAALRETRQSWWAGLGVLIAVSAKLSMLPLAIVCLLPLTLAPRVTWLVPLLLLASALAGHAWYNQARFGTFLETGYGAQATLAAYTTPLLVGLYGLLASSGKGVMWFAPGLWLAIPGWVLQRRAGAAHARSGVAIAVAIALALALYAKFEHWAGDGSFGPRYLVPLLPLAFLPVAFFLHRAGPWRRALAIVLATAGLAVQLGGVAIYFGAQMREAGDYPYTRALNDPEFMRESHFEPKSSPILGHWRMLIRNTRDHLDRKLPKLAGGKEADPRVGIGAADQEALLRGLDVWWLYTLYAGLPPLAVVAGLLMLLFAAGWSALRMLVVTDEEASVR